MIEEYGWGIVISVYTVYTIGFCGALIIVIYLLNKTYTALLSHFRIYDEFVRFVYDRNRKKQVDVYTPKINRKEESE